MSRETSAKLGNTATERKTKHAHAQTLRKELRQRAPESKKDKERKGTSKRQRTNETLEKPDHQTNGHRQKKTRERGNDMVIRLKQRTVAEMQEYIKKERAWMAKHKDRMPLMATLEPSIGDLCNLLIQEGLRKRMDALNNVPEIEPTDDAKWH